MPRRAFASEVEIDAPVDEVWKTLIDLPSYRRWNPFTIDAVATLDVGETIEMRVRMLKLGGMVVTQRETIRTVEPNRRVVWGMSMLGDAILAERTQTLTGLENARTRYHTEDIIEGSLGGLVFALFGPSIQAGFDAMAQALRDEVMRRRRSAA